MRAPQHPQPRHQGRVRHGNLGRRSRQARTGRKGADVRYAAAIALWLLAWACAGLGAAGIFSARNGRRGVALAELAAVLAAAGLAWAGAAAW